MPEERTYEIIEKLLEKSRKGEAEWQDTYTEDRFAIYLPDSSMTIQGVEGPFGEDWFRFSILNERGTVVDSVEIRGSTEHHEKASELYVLARRKALAVEERLDSIFQELESEGAIGEEPPPF